VESPSIGRDTLARYLAGVFRANVQMLALIEDPP
jgi:hypothetical protein